MFIIGGLGYILPTILFWFFGSAEVQEWNEIRTHDDNQHNQSMHTEVQPTFVQHSIENDAYEEKRTKF